jgi:hypothetical protein
VASYIKKYGLSWVFSVNEQNLGWKRNYLENLPKANGDIIFLCDQDDIWLADKCEVMMAIMETTPDCNLLLSNYYPYITDGGTNVSRRSRHHSDNRKIKKIPCNLHHLQATLRPGCTYCLQKSFFAEVSGYWNGELSHDGFLFYMGLLTQSVYLLNFRSIKFRRHGNNNSPLIAPSAQGILHNIGQIEGLMALHLSFLEEHPLENQERVMANIHKIQDWCQKRRAFFMEPSFWGWLKLLFGYHTVYLTAKTILRDWKLARNPGAK